MNKYFVFLTAAFMLVGGVAHGAYSTDDPQMNPEAKARLAAVAPPECPLIKAAQLAREKALKANLLKTADATSAAGSANNGTVLH